MRLRNKMFGAQASHRLAAVCGSAALLLIPLSAVAGGPMMLAQSSSDPDARAVDHASVSPLPPASDSPVTPALSPSTTLNAMGNAGDEVGRPFGRVRRITGDVVAIASDSADGRHLKPGDLVKVGDHLQSSLGGEVLIEETDGGLLALRPGTELWIDSYAAEGKPTDHAIVRLLTGAARAVTGWIGHLNRPGVRMVTPTATIGVRGTDHEAYVLSPAMADASHEPQGSYDKVNRGGTVLSAANQDLAIAPGQVGFVGAAKANTRGLMTLLLPVLLKKVPAFYVPGRFDKEIDDYAKTADKTSDQLLQKQTGGASIPSSAAVECDPAKVGAAWLRALDVAQEHRDYKEILRLYADDAAIKATVRGANGETADVNFDHNQFSDSVEASMKGLKNFHQDRTGTQYEASTEKASEGCPDVVVKSAVSEKGEMQGKSYRFVSVETYLLELRQGRWLGVSSLTVQQ